MKKINCDFCIVLMVFALFAGNLYSQDYFGRNKIQYQNFNFSILKTKNFDIYYYPEERAATGAYWQKDQGTSDR